jgi:hypothetical protein
MSKIKDDYNAYVTETAKDYVKEYPDGLLNGEWNETAYSDMPQQLREAVSWGQFCDDLASEIGYLRSQKIVYTTNLGEIRERAAGCFADGLGEEGFIVDNVREFMFSNAIVSGEATSYDEEKAVFESLTEDKQAEIEHTVREELEAQGWEFTV